MRIERHAPTGRTNELRRDMATFVTSKGFALDKVFIDTDDSASSAFAALIDALREGEVTVVVVPSVRNFARIEGVGVAMMKLIESETGASVMIVSTPSCGAQAGSDDTLRENQAEAIRMERKP
jgi:DNA invertase Pin-like site-specific DNA recombinase